MPERDLARLLAGADPIQRPGEFVFCTVDPASGLPAGVHPEATVYEPEGLSAVVARDVAAQAGLDHDDTVFGWLTLQVHSALDAVGLTAAVAGALAEHGISANVIAGRHHDHVLVPVDEVGSALDLLSALGQDRD